jgi:uncharacterized protein YndB with AHSA1/START domain
MLKREINLRWFYPYSPEEIWDCITNPATLKQWSNLHRNTDFKAEVGFKWMEEQKPRRGWDGKMYFEVLEVVPVEILKYSFKGGPRPGEVTLDTIVTWKLVSKNFGTEVHLCHTGFRGLKGVMTSFIMEKGWDKHFATKLLNYLKQKKNERISV